MKKCLSIIFCFIISFTSFSEIRKGSLAAFSIINNAQKSTKYTAKDYVQNGLVFMWDGIENVNYGEHSDETMLWIDLIHMKKLNGNVINGNSFKISSTSIISGFTLANDMTIELVRNSSIDFTTSIMLTYGGYGSGNIRYAISGVRSGYAFYQLRYWNGAKQIDKYFLKEYIPIAITYSENHASIYGNCELLGRYDDAIASEINGLVI